MYAPHLRWMTSCVTVAFLLTMATDAVFGADSRAEIVNRVADDIRYFASDELEGRGVETRGIELAADRILAEYQKHGLKPAMPDGSYRQPFEVAVGASAVSKDTLVQLRHADGRVLSLKMGAEFQPLRRGASGKSSGELFFVGYGISSAEDKYDDYADVSVKGKIVVLLRREPQQNVPDGAFQGPSTSSHSYIERKLQLAKNNGAAGVIFVNDAVTASTPNDDELTQPTGFGSQSIGMPFVHVKQSVINQLLQSNPLKVDTDGAPQELNSLTAICEQIDRTLKPVSQPLDGWSADLSTLFDSKSVTAFNLIGVLEGEGPRADETIVVGAHYDHLGFGGFGSRAANRTGEVHNGADDNATGTAAVLEIIRRITAGQVPGRRIVFICFSGEERGLLGSNYYVDHPVIPLEKTVAMLNYDMIGTLRNNNVEVNGVGTAKEFRAIVDVADDASPLDITVVENPFAGSDHLPFFQRNIPVMFCFTGVTPRYHTPDDDFETINVEGVVSVVDYTESLLRGIAALPKAPTFQKVSRNSRAPQKLPYLGIVPDIGEDAGQPGIPVQSVRPESPALAAGMLVGDVILKVDNNDINDFDDLISFLRNQQPGKVVRILVKRAAVMETINVTLGKPR